MDIDQIIFKKLYRLIKRIRQPGIDPVVEARTATLAGLKGRLTVLARALTGQNIELFTAEREGGWSSRAFFLPENFSHGSTHAANVDFYVFRVCYLAVQQQLGFNWTTEEYREISLSRSQARQTAPAVLDRLYQLFPPIRDVAGRLIATETAFQERLAPGQQPDLSLLWGRWMSPSDTPISCIDTPVQQHPAVVPATTPTTELRAPAREEMTVLAVNQQEIQDYTLMHSFEKVETIEEFKGNWRDLDGADELSEHAESLAELDLRETVRVDTPTHSVYQTEWFRNATAPESREADSNAPCVLYDEWDAGKRAYKRGYCRVYPTVALAEQPDYAATVLQTHSATYHTLRRRIQRAYTEREQVKRQPAGEEPDLDEVINTFADMRAGRTPSDMVYVSRQRRRRDIAVLLLMDISLSTDSYTGGRRILDVEKQSVLLFGEALASFDDRFRIDGFYSRTRNRCHYATVKSFENTWAQGRRRLGAIEPQGYTRIGPALRHATSLLVQEPAAKRWILLLSDGKPNDYDRYEGAYGIADVRQALREAEQQHVRVHALAVESEARFYLPGMFGRNGYSILPHPGDLPGALTDFYTALLR